MARLQLFLCQHNNIIIIHCHPFIGHMINHWLIFFEYYVKYINDIEAIAVQVRGQISWVKYQKASFFLFYELILI